MLAGTLTLSGCLCPLSYVWPHVPILCCAQMLLQALILFPSLDTNHTSLTMSCGDSLADQVSIAEQANKPAELELGFEQHFRAGSFKGRVELQVVYKTQRGIQLFAGSLLPSEGYGL